ncbi:hypothetical protein [Viridibacterium curvum]|uniref:Uncharacterized protein n=1 Tax=Viridibacterium curvum TaxID=1101404 RepID=A0ABP9QJN8_9RHOO
MKLTAIALLATLLASCGVFDTMKEGFKHSEDVAAELEKSVGSKPFVGFNWNNGILTNINISFEGIPADKTTAEIAALARTSISQHFKQTPKSLIVSFSLPGTADEGRKAE